MDPLTLDETLAAVTQAATSSDISEAAATNIRLWLTEPFHNPLASVVNDHVAEGKWKALEDAFWTVLPFGTAGRRGPMYPIGTATINDRTIGESAQGLADYCRQELATGDSLRCAVAYDTRHNSRHFAELCCEVMGASGFTVYLLNDPRSTPELSYTVRRFQCDCGIMISASHNPARDNAIKVFGPNGGQLCPPRDTQLAHYVAQVTEIRRTPFTTAIRDGQIICCEAEIDPKYQQAVLAHSFTGPRELTILYSSMHGVGLTSVLPILRADGFAQVEAFQPHIEMDGDFPNVPPAGANPENPAVFLPLIARAQQIGADLILASDPDADRIGCAVPTCPGGPWQVLSGNQIGALLADYILRHRRATGTLNEQNYIVKTLVTSEMIRRVADWHQVRTFGEVLTGFKWISSLVDQLGSEPFVFGCEEAHGFMVGDYVRDKDAAVAAMLLAELAAELKSRGQTLFQELNRLFRLVGYHAERTVVRSLPGADGLEKMRNIMDQYRQDPPTTLASLSVRQVRDFGNGLRRNSAGQTTSLTGPRSELLFFDLEREGNYAAVRPSGTEPTLKFYLFAYQPPNANSDLEAVSTALQCQLDEMERDLLRMIDG